ncbi:MAG: hypothetical protein IPP52_17295 [Ignavibacteria bacterium]|nr:hypothetical protein [Ignavibacteria bacterium]
MEENKYKYMQDAVKDFRENVMEIKKDKVAGTLEIGIYDKNPQKRKECRIPYLHVKQNKFRIKYSKCKE